jgi:hypothetical protein
MLDRIASAGNRLYEKLVDLDFGSLNLSEYNQRYLEGKIAGLRGVLQLYGKLFYLSLNDKQTRFKKAVIVDYGGGSGLISLMAAEMGIGTVVYNDIYDVSCLDVQCLAQALKLPLQHVVCGNADVLASYLQKNAISVDAIISYDVIEHIYDLESHFKTLGNLRSDCLKIVYASGANSANPYCVRSAKRIQIEAEYKDREKKWGHKERDHLRAYLDARKEIITSYAPELSSEEIAQLARSTRGLMRLDIERCIEEFRGQGETNYRINHPTNTCDPYTGNWCEHLMDFRWLENVLKKEGFSAQILPGAYSKGGPFPKRSAKWILNATIRILGRRGLFVAPYFIVYAKSN